ncbi:MAG: isochorismate synthase [Myxococcales bacterium]|nr:isochorismate synthase [Myxococcales bacterium]
MIELRRALREALPLACSDAAAVAVGGCVEIDPEEVAVPAGVCWSFWDTRQRPDLVPETSLGVGRACGARARGVARLVEARARLTSVMAAIETVGEPRVRAFGGLAFEPGAVGPFVGLGDLDFAIPRWTLTRSEGRTRVTLVVAPRELAEPERLLSELRGLAQGRARRSTGKARWADDGKARFLEAARRAVTAVEAAELEKVVVVRRALLEGRLDARAVLDALGREASATRFAASDGTTTFLGATPELLVSWDGAVVRSEAVAGTSRRDRDPDELRRSAKDRLEHEYVVRAISDALGRSQIELDAVREPVIRSLRHVHHLVTPLSGKPREPRHVLDLVSALHPTPAVLGVPAAAARAFIARAEHFDRGWFAAPFGWVDAKGHGCFVVGLRSALIEEARAWLFAGAGIVRGSTPEAELGETDAKLRTLLATLQVDAADDAHAGSAP